jgi:hypothetical protein
MSIIPLLVSDLFYRARLQISQNFEGIEAHNFGMSLYSELQWAEQDFKHRFGGMNPTLIDACFEAYLSDSHRLLLMRTNNQLGGVK